MLSLDASNNTYAVWQDERNGSGKPDIYYQKRTAAGVWLPSGSDKKVNDDAGGGGGAVQRNPSIAGTAAGAQTAAWVDLRSNQNNIWSSRLAVGGTDWAPNLKVTVDNSTALKDFPDVAVGADGTSYAVWQDSRNGNADIFFSTLTSSGGAWAANLKISDDPGTAAQTNPRIGVDGGGNLVAAWIDARTSPARVRVARKPAAGAWSASIEISPSPANVQSLALSVRPDGFAWAVWGDTRAGATNQDIWGSRYDPSLNAWSASVRLDDDPGTSANQLNPTVAFGPAETMLSWRDNRLSTNGDTQARRVLFIQGMTDRFTLAYDGLNRLKSVSGPVAESFALDGASNVTNRSGTLETYDNANRLTADGGTALTWSNADRLTNRGSDTFGYDALDRMTSSNVAGTARTYTYNGDGLLQTRTGGVGASFLWDPSSAPSRELKQNSDNIIYGLGPLYVVKADATTLTFVRDGSKNVRAELNAAGAVTGAFRYRAYGQLAQSTTPGPSYLGLASQLLDPSGLYYMRARWYDPVTGRFIARDPIKGQADAPASLNAFGYADANPLVASDPSGLCTDPRPGTTGARYCIAAYIPTTQSTPPLIGLLTGDFAGDDRGPQSNGGSYRLQFGVDANGRLIGQPDSDPTINIRRDGSRTVAQSTPHCAQRRHGVSCYAKNPFTWFAPAIKIAVDVSSDGSITVSGTAYPSVEVWRYDGEDGIATNLADYDAGTSFWQTSGLFLGADYLTAH